MICFILSEFSYFSLKFNINRSKLGQKFAELWLPKAKLSGLTDVRRLDFFRKIDQLMAAILLYQSLLERPNFVKL